MPVTLVAHDRPTCRFAWNALVGAVLAHPATRGVPVELARTPGDVARRAAEALAAGRTPVVGWSFYTASAGQVAAELAEVRARLPDPRVLHLAGGAHASGAPEATLRAGFELAAVGEGEETLPRLLAAVEAGADPRTVAGHAFEPLPGTPWRAEPRGVVDPVTGALLARLHAGGRAYGEL